MFLHELILLLQPEAKDSKFVSVILYTLDQGNGILDFNPSKEVNYRLAGTAEKIGKFALNIPHIKS